MKMNKKLSASVTKRFALVVSVAALTIGVSCASASPSHEVRKPRRSELLPCHTLAVTRTFLGVSSDQLGWGESDWLNRFEDLRSLGFSEVIMEYSSSNELEFFVRSMPESDDRSPIGAMTRAAAKTGVGVWMGLHRDSVDAASRDLDGDELASLLHARLQKIEDRLYPLLLSILRADPNNSVFRGWYLPDAINSEGWIDPHKHEQMTHYLYGLKSMLKRLQPDWPVMLSAVLNNDDVDPEQLLESWRRLTSAAGANVLLFELADAEQFGDATEANKDNASDVVSHWLKLVSSALEHDQMNVGATIRLFSRTDDGERVRATSFSSLRESLGKVRQYGREPLTVFPIPRHMLAEDDLTSQSLRKRWIRDQKACRGTPSRLVMRAGPFVAG